MEKTLKLKIIIGNDAFVEDENAELSRILKDLAKRIERGQVAGTLRDYNGNMVGQFFKGVEFPIDYLKLCHEIFNLMASDDFGNHTSPEFLLTELLKKRI